MEEEGTAALCAIGSSDRKAIMGRLHVQGSLDFCLQVSPSNTSHPWKNLYSPAHAKQAFIQPTTDQNNQKASGNVLTPHINTVYLQNTTDGSHNTFGYILLHFKIKALLVEKFGIEGREKKSFFFSFYCMEILPNEPNGEMAKALLARLLLRGGLRLLWRLD